MRGILQTIVGSQFSALIFWFLLHQGKRNNTNCFKLQKRNAKNI